MVPQQSRKYIRKTISYSSNFLLFLCLVSFGFSSSLQARVRPEKKKLDESVGQIAQVEQIPLPPGKNYVTICQEGNQLGGQLTTFAVVLGYAWTYGLSPVFPKEMLLKLPGGGLNYQYIFHRLPQELPLGGSKKAPFHYFAHIYGVNQRVENYLTYRGGNACLCACPPYPLVIFHLFQSRIREIFAPSKEIIQALQEKYSFIMDHPKTVAIHIRAYDPRTVPHQCLGKEYYEKAMSYFSDDYLFVVFSDRIGWCKDHLKFEDKNVIFIEGNTHIFDFYLMSFCKNIITANSTFSWWAAYLKQDEDGLILAPEKWFPNEDSAYRMTFYPDHYTIIPLVTFIRDWSSLDYETTSNGDT